MQIQNKLPKDEIACLITRMGLQLIKAHWEAHISKPPACDTHKYRFMKPEFFNYLCEELFGQEMLKVVEHKGLPHDWELCGKKITLKEQRCDRKKIWGSVALTVKNTRGVFKPIQRGDFDYLLAPLVSKGQIGLYLFTFEKVMELIKDRSMQNGCDQDGYDGSGEIKVHLESNADSVAFVESYINDDEIIFGYGETIIRSDYITASAEERDQRWLKSQRDAIAEQIKLTRRRGNK